MQNNHNVTTTRALNQSNCASSGIFIDVIYNFIAENINFGIEPPLNGF